MLISSIQVDFSYADDPPKPIIVYNNDEVLPDSSVQKIGTVSGQANLYLATLPQGAQPKTITWGSNFAGSYIMGAAAAHTVSASITKEIGLADISSSKFPEEKYLIGTQFTQAPSGWEGYIYYTNHLPNFQLDTGAVIPTTNVKGFVVRTSGTAGTWRYLILQTSAESTDKTTLSAIVTEGTAISNSGIYYTENDRYNGKNTSINGFWTDFRTALTSAGAINADANARQEQVDAAAAALTGAAVKLIPTSNINATALYEELQISNPKRAADYTAETWPAFAAARTTAQAIFAQLYDENGNPTTYNSSTGDAASEVPAATAALTAAREGLFPASQYAQYVGIVESTQAKINTLKEIIGRNPLNEEDYTPESWNAYQEKLAAVASAPTLTGTNPAADQGAANAYGNAFAALNNAYYRGLQPVGEITVELTWIDQFNLQDLREGPEGPCATYQGGVTLQGDTSSSYSLDAALAQKGLAFSKLGEAKDLTIEWENKVYINGVYIGGRFDGVGGVVLHPGDKVSVLWSRVPQSHASPTAYPATADFWQYEGSLKAASFRQADGFTVEAGQAFTLEVEEVRAAFGAKREPAPGEGMSIYVSDVTDSAIGISPAGNPVIIDGEAVTTDAEGRAAFALYEEGWHLVAAYDIREDIWGDLVQWPEDAIQRAGTYHCVNSGALIWVHVTESRNPEEVKAGLKAKLDAVYNEYPESYFRQEPLPGIPAKEPGKLNSWLNLKAAYDTAAQGIAEAETIGGAYNEQNAGIIAIKAIQKDTSAENTFRPDKLRGFLSRLPDDSALITQSVAGLVNSAITTYNNLSDYQKTRLSTVETEKCNMLINLIGQEGGLPAAEDYTLSYEIEADTPETEAAIEDMIAYLQEHNTIKDWEAEPRDIRSQDFGLPGNQGKPDADKLLQFNVAISTTNAAVAAPDARVVLITDIGRYAYLLVRQDAGHSITGTSGAAWTISDENFKFSEPTGSGYSVQRNMTIRINGTEYELKSIEYQGIEERSVRLEAAPSFIDRSTYKGRMVDDPNINITFPDSQLYFAMPYNDVNIIFHWGTVGSAADIEAAKAAAISDLQDRYDSFDLPKYNSTERDALLAAKEAGEIAINAAATLSEISAARKAALAAMMAVKPAAEPQLPPGVVLPDLGPVVGQVRVSVRNDTYPGGDFTGKIIDGWYDLCEEDTMMTAILRALATEGYTWKGTGGTGGAYDYRITYLSSIEKGSRKLAEFSGEAGSGWMGTLNDWFVNEGFQSFRVENGKLENGDIIEVQYTQNLGVDIGGTWGNSDTSLKALSVSGGTLAPSFKGSILEYTLLIDTDRAAVTLTPTASNKNYLVKTFLNYYNRDSAFYKRTESISVKDGDIIYVGVGDRAWPSMNKQGEEARDYTGTKYIIKVKKSGADTVKALISALPDASRITYANYESYIEKVKEAKTAYDALSDKSETAKTYVNYAKLTAVEAKVQYYADIDTVKALLAAIPSASKVTLSHKANVMAADAAYKQLDAAQKKYITVGDVTNYNAAIDRLTALGAFSSGTKPSKIEGTEEIPKEGGSVELQPEATIVGNEGRAKISDADAKKAVEDLKAGGGNELFIQPKLDKDVDKLTVELPKTALKEIADDTKAVVTVKSNVAEITLSQEALKTIAQEAGSNVSITAERLDNSKLSDENKALVGDNPVFNLSIGVDGKAVKNFNGNVKISLPYTPKPGENIKKLTVYYIDDTGKAAEMTGAYYDEKTGSIVFDTDHFSAFAIVYDKNKMIFDDVKEGAWYFDAVNFAVNNNLFNGVSDTKFAPDLQMTRAMLVTVLYRMDQTATAATGGIVAASGSAVTGSAVTASGSAVTGSAVTTDKPAAESFTDVKDGQWYTDAVIWANANGITAGIGNGLFGTNNNVTREQMAAILYNYANYKGYDIVITAGIESFADATAVRSWAQPAMKWANTEGLITGRTDTTLVPGGSATRAEVATILKRFVEGIAEQ